MSKKKKLKNALREAIERSFKNSSEQLEHVKISAASEQKPGLKTER
jgi:hypothetical protein